MPKQSSESNALLQSKLNKASNFVATLLLPNSKVSDICHELEFTFRECVYTPMVTVWMFISQVLSADHSCQQAVTKLNSWRTARGLPRCSSETTSYCKARGRLPEKLFERLLHWTSDCCNETTDNAWLFHGREVEMVDGLTVTMADTLENQAEYPQQKSQRTGCGFPLARMVLVFSLATGAASLMAIGRYAGKLTGETSLLRTLLDHFKPGKILLADRYYANYWLLALSQLKQIDMVARAHQLRKIDFRKGLRLGYYDQLVTYPRPAKPAWLTKAEYASYPPFIQVRHLRYQVEQPGYRTRVITLATTLLDADEYTAEDLADLYRRRWLVELHIRSLKTQMQMDHLRCKSPSMVRKEIYCHLVGYNAVRMAMLASALKFTICPSKLSFTGAMQALEEFGASLRLHSAGRRDQQWENLLTTISELRVGDRPGRSEPRVVKRRPKSYKLLRQPRQTYATHYTPAA